ncbi:hypothetical protein [uncultured Clostridium sp.]|uniref:hypothetical protein n=1 Tax=uncultured Clostridium sp. TaxID=59620 RepID=UPI0025E4DB83|nr:hypothetical protein [uncultured Clostridium sp.]
MKKKYLSLVMAAMMSLGAVVQASAVTLSGNEADTLSQPVEVTGTVSAADGQAPAGRIEVELPTTMTFSVDKNGAFNGVDYSVRNASKVGIKVSVAEFKKSKTTGGITVLAGNTDAETLKEKTRDNVILKLKGTTGEVDLHGFIDNGSKPAEEILKVEANNTRTIKLIGDAGKKVEKSAGSQTEVDKNGVSETFTLRFSIAKDEDASLQLPSRASERASTEEGPWNEVASKNEEVGQE